MPHEFVNALAQDGDGYLWIGTEGGLVRWDGMRFRLWKQEAGNPYSLPENLVVTLQTDIMGRLWVGAMGGGVARYDAQSERFIRFGIDAQGVSNGAVYALSADNMGGMWVGSMGGLDHLSKDGLRLEHFSAGIGKALPPGGVRAVLHDVGGSIWIGSMRGLYQIDGEGKPIRHIPLPGVIEQPEIWSLTQSSDGRIWIGSKAAGIFVLDPANTQIQALRLPPALQQTRWWSLYEASLGEIWAGSDGQGLLRIDSKTLSSRNLRYQAGAKLGLLDNSVTAIMRDKSGVLWLGSWGGLNQRIGQSELIQTISTPISGAARSAVTAITRQSDGSLWLGQDNGALINIKPDGAVKLHAPGSFNLPQVRINAVQQDQQDLLLGTRNGLYRSDASLSKIQPITLPGMGENTIIWSIAQACGGIWVGSSHGLWRYNKSQGLFRQSGSEALNHMHVSVMLCDAQQRLWIGTMSDGLFLFDGKQAHAIAARRKDDKTAPGVLEIASNSIGALMQDADGRIWVGTQGGGMAVLRPGPGGETSKPAAQLLRSIDAQQGLPNPQVLKILQAADGKIWAATGAGLVWIDSRNLNVHPLLRADGDAIRVYRTNSGLRYDDVLLFGGNGGISVVRDTPPPWRPRALPLVSELRVGNQALPSRPYLRQGKVLQIQPHANSLSLELAALDYSEPAVNRVGWWLEGWDPAWQEGHSGRRNPAWTNLPPGQYKLRLKAMGRNGIWGEERNIAIEVLPAWHQTWWARLVYTLGAISAIAMLVCWRTRNLRRRSEQLQSANQALHDANTRMNQANEALNDANVELEQAASTLEQLSDIGRAIAASLDAQTVFQSIYLYMSSLVQAHCVALYRVNASGAALESLFEVEHGKTVEAHEIDLHDSESLAARAVREQREILAETPSDQVPPSHIPGTRVMHSALFAPLLVDQKVVGVLSVQSERQQAFGERERLIFRTLCGYGAIALHNAQAFSRLEQANALILRRTDELMQEKMRTEEANAALAVSLQDLQAAQNQLIQAEKMASLGQLVAHVAHEINNPLGAIKSSGDLMQEVLPETMLHWPQLLLTLPAEQLALCLRLLACACRPRAVRSTREARAAQRELSSRLQALEINPAPRRAEQLLAIQAENMLEECLPLLRSAQAEAVLQQLCQLALLCGNLDTISAAVEKVSKLVLALKNFSRADSLGLRVAVNLRDTLETVLTLYQHQLKPGRGIELECEYEEVPVIECQPDALSQVWTNLIHNALQAMQHKGRLRIQLRQCGDEVMVAISDSGCGIAPEIRERIFDPFFTTKPLGEGTGLGLGIAQKIIAAHHGRIEVHSEPGAGATFCVFLPLKAPAEAV
ncbi:two-component regulator propeller domain-containing protein [Massilia sp. W12]|uniref:sensor histidine kinase n=1 Tax=Massilia sp. W12 TaxID=3126507 RepID=UPI0030D339B8